MRFQYGLNSFSQPKVGESDEPRADSGMIGQHLAQHKLGLAHWPELMRPFLAVTAAIFHAHGCTYAMSTKFRQKVAGKISLVVPAAQMMVRIDNRQVRIKGGLGMALLPIG